MQISTSRVCLPSQELGLGICIVKTPQRMLPWVAPDPHFERAGREHTGSRSRRNPPRLVPGYGRAEPQPSSISPVTVIFTVASQALHEVTV